MQRDPAKIQAVGDWPMQSSRKEVQQFLGFANFFHKFIKTFCVIAAFVGTQYLCCKYCFILVVCVCLPTSCQVSCHYNCPYMCLISPVPNQPLSICPIHSTSICMFTQWCIILTLVPNQVVRSISGLFNPYKASLHWVQAYDGPCRKCPLHQKKRGNCTNIRVPSFGCVKYLNSNSVYFFPSHTYFAES